MCIRDRVCATAVRVPVYRSHSESINIETEKPLSPDEARAILAKAPGVIVVDDPANSKYPMPLFSSDTDEVYVGRIRKDISCDGNGLCQMCIRDSFWLNKNDIHCLPHLTLLKNKGRQVPSFVFYMFG